MESETETENYKNTSMPPSARLEENKKKEPFSSAATGSLSAVTSGTSSPESAILAGFQPSISQAGLNTHRQERAGSARRQEGQPPCGSPLWAQALGLFWGTAPRTTRVALSSETHGRGPTGPRPALRLSHLTPFSLKTSPLPHCHRRRYGYAALNEVYGDKCGICTHVAVKELKYHRHLLLSLN